MRLVVLRDFAVLSELDLFGAAVVISMHSPSYVGVEWMNACTDKGCRLTPTFPAYDKFVRLEPFPIIRNRLTVFSRLLARHAPRRGLVDRKRGITTSSGREKAAFGGPNSPIWCVAALAR